MQGVQTELLESRTLFAVEAEIVKDIVPGPASGMSTVSLVPYKGHIYFSANDQQSGFELWRTDGTEDGTDVFKDINADDLSSFPGTMTVAGNLLYFFANDGEHGSEPWVSDGTADGTKMIKDLNNDPAGSSVQNIVKFGDSIFFRANDADNQPSLWRARNGKVKKIALPESESAPIPVGGIGKKFYFLYSITDDPANGLNDFELWSVSKSGKNAKPIEHVGEQPDGSSFYTPQNFAVFRKKIFFRTHKDGEYAIWRSDGTKKGTFKLRNDTVNAGIFFGNLTGAGKYLYFTVSREDEEALLVRTNGKRKGTKVIKSITRAENSPQFDITDPVKLKKSVYFAIANGRQNEFWKTDGTKKGTKLVKQIDEDSDSRITSVANVKGKLYFAADGTAGTEVWISNGKKKGTKLLVDVRPGPGSSFPFGFVGFNNTVFFSATTDAGQEPHKLVTDPVSFSLLDSDDDDLITTVIR